MVSTYVVYVTIENHSNEKSLQDAINITCALVKDVFKNNVKSVETIENDMGYIIRVKFGFILRGIDLEDATKRAFKLLFDTFRSKPERILVDSHTSGWKLEYIDQPFKLERIE